VPMPRTLFLMCCGYLFDRSFNPSISLLPGGIRQQNYYFPSNKLNRKHWTYLLPDSWAKFNRLSRLTTSTTFSSRRTFDGSPIHVLKILSPCWGLM
jgi:hypothetical protein